MKVCIPYENLVRFGIKLADFELQTTLCAPALPMASWEFTTLKKQGDQEMNKHSAVRNQQSPFLAREIMTPREAAEYLSVHVRTIYRLVKNRGIPGRKVGGSWRFKKDTLDQWLSCREDFPPNGRDDQVKT